MQLQILYYRLHFRFRERTVTATFQMKKQSPFATVFPMSHVTFLINIHLLTIKIKNKKDVGLHYK